ncbi:hypothetical protein ILUMI_07997, partial [Ignelater luminosus]
MSEETTQAVPKTSDPDTISISSIHSTSSAHNHDIGLQRLKAERDKITYAGKYMDRYKDEFSRKPIPPPRKEFQLSARYRDIHGNILNPINQNGHSATNNNFSFSSLPKSPIMGQTNSTPKSPMMGYSNAKEDSEVPPPPYSPLTSHPNSPKSPTDHLPFKQVPDIPFPKPNIPKSPIMNHTDDSLESPKSARNVKLKEILSSPVSECRKVIINSPLSGSPIMSNKTNNATHELNKAENMSQLTSFKLVTDAKIMFKQNKSHEGSPKIDKKHKKKDGDLNIYAIQPVQTSPSLKPSIEINLKFPPPPGEPPSNMETLNSLQQVQNYISLCEAEAIRRKNLQKFDEMLKQKNTNNAKKPPVIENKMKDKSQDIDVKQFEHINEPLKSYNEVEDLLRPGLSDMQAENVESFERGNKIRSSTTGVQRSERLKVLSRASSDAQDRVQLQRKKPVAKIRHNRNVSQESQ